MTSATKSPPPSRSRRTSRRSPPPRPTASGCSSTPAAGRTVRCACWSSGRRAGSPLWIRSRADLRRLADPRALQAAEVAQLIKGLPVVVWLMHAVHGNEISSSDAALAEAYHLLAAQGDPAVDVILQNALVLIDPLQNPDGRARFVADTLLGRAASPDPEPAAAEHDEPWPGGRSNHYLFDMNRDWFAQTQPETGAGRGLYLEYYPQVVVDLHEMGGESSYYFAPPADPLNPLITRQQAHWFEVFGHENAQAVRRPRFLLLHARGLRFVLSRVRRVVADLPGRHRDDLRAGLDPRTGLPARGRLAAHVPRRGVAPLHGRHGHAARPPPATASSCCATSSTTAAAPSQDDEHGPAGDYVPPARARSVADQPTRAAPGQPGVRGAQGGRAGAGSADATLPAGHVSSSRSRSRSSRLLRNLMERTCPSRRPSSRSRTGGGRSACPIRSTTDGVEPAADGLRLSMWCFAQRPTRVRSTAVAARAAGGEPPKSRSGEGRVRHAVGIGDGRGHRGGACRRASACGAPASRSRWPGASTTAGAAIIRIADNSDEPAARSSQQSPRPTAPKRSVRFVVRRRGHLAGKQRGGAAEGAARAARLGQADAEHVGRLGTLHPRAALGPAGDRGADVALGESTCGVTTSWCLPSGTYSSVPPATACGGSRTGSGPAGRLVCLGEASRWAAQESVGLLDTRTELRDGRPDVEPSDKDQKKGGRPPKPFELDEAIQPERERPDAVPGAIVRVLLDPEHWLSAGTDGEIQAIVDGQRVFTPLKLDKGSNVGRLRQTRQAGVRRPGLGRGAGSAWLRKRS